MENIDCLIWVILSEDLKKKKLALPKQKIQSIKNGVKKIKNEVNDNLGGTKVVQKRKNLYRKETMIIYYVAQL